MPAVINTNIASLNSQRNLNSSQSALQVSLQRLSSGLRINSAKDDAAGLAISERFSTQIRGLNQAARNANDGISLAQTGEGALAAVTDNLQRIRELAVQAANSTNSADDRAAINLEVQQRLAEIDRTASQTSFNGQKLLDGSFDNANFQIGANAGEIISVDLASSNVRNSNIGAVATTTSAVLGAGATGGSITTGAITAGDFSQTYAAATSGKVTVDVGSLMFGTAPTVFAGGTYEVSGVSNADMSVVDAAATLSYVGLGAGQDFTPLSAKLVVGAANLDFTGGDRTGQHFDLQAADGTTIGITLGNYTVGGAGTGGVFTDAEISAALQSQLDAQNSGLTATFVGDGDGAAGTLTFTNVATGPAANSIAVVNSSTVTNITVGGGVFTDGQDGGEFTFTYGDGTTELVSLTGDYSADNAAAWTQLATDIEAQLTGVTVTSSGANALLFTSATPGAEASAMNITGQAAGETATMLDDTGKAADQGTDGTAVTIKVDGLPDITLSGDYSLDADADVSMVGDLQGALDAAAGAGVYTVEKGAGNWDIKITNTASTNGVTISNVAGGASFVGGTSTDGEAASDGTNAQLTIDGYTIDLTADYTTGNFASSVNALLEAESAGGAGEQYISSYTGGVLTISRDDAGGAGSTAIAFSQVTGPAAFTNIASTVGVDEQADTSVSFSVDNQAIVLDGAYADLDDLVDNATTGLQAKLDTAFGANAYSAVVSGTGIVITNNTMGSAAVAISGTDANAQTAGFADATGTAGVAGGSVTLTDLSINGTALAGTYASSDALATEINNTVSGVYATVTNGALTLTSSADMALAGATDTAAMTLTAGTVTANSGSLSAAAVDTVTNANMTIQRIDSALNTVSTLRSTFGAIQNRFESVISSLTATSENLTAARSRIQDTDFAAETAQLTRNQILQQAGTAMLAQANQLPNTVLSLLR